MEEKESQEDAEATCRGWVATQKTQKRMQRVEWSDYFKVIDLEALAGIGFPASPYSQSTSL